MPVSLRKLSKHAPKRKIKQTLFEIQASEDHYIDLPEIVQTSLVEFIASGHQPAAEIILERFEIFGSMVRWFCSAVQLRFKGVLSCRACFSLRNNPPFCFVLM